MANDSLGPGLNRVGASEETRCRSVPGWRQHRQRLRARGRQRHCCCPGVARQREPRSRSGACQGEFARKARAKNLPNFSLYARPGRHRLVREIL